MNSKNTFTLLSNDLGGQASDNEVFNGAGCSGKNISPHLKWINAPAETKSFAITCYDPDAPSGSGWWHWLVFNIPADVTEIETGAGNPSSHKIPENAIQSTTDYGTTGYGGPCPPIGDGIHTYVFTVFALSVEKLDLNAQSNPALVGFQINANTIKKASIVTYYER